VNERMRLEKGQCAASECLKLKSAIAASKVHPVNIYKNNVRFLQMPFSNLTEFRYNTLHYYQQAMIIITYRV
jgi:hypothetical protein